MKVMFNGKEVETTVNKWGHHVAPNGDLVSVDGVEIKDPSYTIPEPTYTREQLLAMTVAELDEVEVPLDIDGYYSMLKADKQTALLEALGL